MGTCNVRNNCFSGFNDCDMNESRDHVYEITHHSRLQESGPCRPLLCQVLPRHARGRLLGPQSESESESGSESTIGNMGPQCYRVRYQIHIFQPHGRAQKNHGTYTKSSPMMAASIYKIISDDDGLDDEGLRVGTPIVASAGPGETVWSHGPHQVIQSLVCALPLEDPPPHSGLKDDPMVTCSIDCFKSLLTIAIWTVAWL